MKRVKTDKQIIELLDQTGHLRYPFGKYEPLLDSIVDHISPTSHFGERAIRSYQDFMLPDLEPLCLKHHSRPARCDGEMGPATYELFDLDRCGCPDYGPEVQPAIGKGSWAGCHDIGKFHSALVSVDDSGMPKWLRPLWYQVWDNVVAAYDAIGLRFVHTMDHSEANIVISFVPRSRGWIGLAIVGQGQSCGSHIWAQFLATWKPRDIVNEWTSLVMHELGHNASLQHTRRGHMSAVITSGLKPTWRGDASEPILKRLYGGEPIDSTPKPPEPPVPPKPPADDPSKLSGILTRYRWNEKEQRNVPVDWYDMTPRPGVPEEVPT